MRYWLCVLTPENFEVVKEKLVWGVEPRHEKYLKELRPGDKLVMYVTRESKIKGIFEVESEPYYDGTEIFEGGIYPHRVKIKAIKISDEGINIKEILNEISIFKGKKNWAGVIQGKAMREITEEDYKKIAELLGA